MKVKQLINNKWIYGIGTAVIAGLILFLFIGSTGNSQKNINSSSTQSPQCIGNNCQQIITYTQINTEEKSVYTSPAKKLIKANMSDYSFPFKIINELPRDFNDVGLMYVIPVDYGMQQIMIMPRDRTERVTKDFFQIMLPCIGWPKDDKYIGVCDIESIYKLEIKEYEITINTRNYGKDFYMEFELINLSQYPQLKEGFRGFGG